MIDAKARTRLLEILKGATYWIDDLLPDGGNQKERSGPVKNLAKDENGWIAFSCGGWTTTIESSDRLEISGQCVVAYRTAGSGRKLICVYAPVAARDEAIEVMNERMS